MVFHTKEFGFLSEKPIRDFKERTNTNRFIRKTILVTVENRQDGSKTGSYSSREVLQESWPHPTVHAPKEWRR